MSSLLVAFVALPVALAVYSYVLYPACLAVLGAARHRAEPGTDRFEWPPISVTVPAYNEEASIRDTLNGLLALDYPADRMQIVVVSDASTDRTDDIVREFSDRGVLLVRLPTRMGKTAAENAAMKRITGDVVVNTDASVRVAPTALKPLISAFADPSTGVASGRDVSVSWSEVEPGAGEAGYVGYEMWVRRLETRVDGIVGASGCFYAARTILHRQHVPEALSRDFAAPLIAREHGFRSVSVDDAVCLVPRSVSLRREYRRKVRTMARGLETLAYKRHLLNPMRYGLFAWMLASHKLSRWLVAPAGAAALVGLTIASVGQVWIWWIGGGLVAAAGMGTLGWLWPEHRRLPRPLALSAFVVLGNLAALDAWRRAIRGEHNPAWEPTRRAPAVRPGGE